MRSIEQEEKIIEETILLVNLFLKTNVSDIELSKMTGISSSTVGRRLNNMQNILRAFPNNGLELFNQIKEKRQENLAKGKALGGQTTLLNHIYIKDEVGKFTGSTKLRLDIIYSNEEKQSKFLVHAALYFRLHLDTLSNIFQIDEKELLEKLLNTVPGAYDALKFLFYHDGKDQDIAKDRFINYYRELLNAIRLKDAIEKKKLINMITDVKAAQIKKNREAGNPLTNEDIETILRYQLKYALTAQNISYIFNINRSNYQKRILAFLQIPENIELKEEYESLADYNAYRYKERSRHE